MKILCICEHGNVRSVGLAYILKTLFKHEAIAIGVDETSIETKMMLYEWADKIIFVEPELSQTLVAEAFIPKFILLNVGKDIWFDAKHQGLVHRLYKELSKHSELWK